MNPEKNVTDDPMSPIPLDQRQNWMTPAMIFGGLEFCVPIIMIGSMLATSFSLAAILPILIVAFIVIQWPGNSLNGYIGSQIGRTSSVLARGSFGAGQSRVIIALVISVACMGWWAIQTSVTGNSICAMFGIDYTDPANRGTWIIITIISGAVFAAPSIIGIVSMKWMDYIAVPAGLLMVVFGIYLGVSHGGGVSAIFSAKPASPGSMTFIGAINLILGMNISQWVVSADYTRFAHPRRRDNILIPLGIVAIGMPLMFVGAIMSIGQGTGDIVQVMVNLGFPVWGFLVLWLSSWTSQIVNNYSMGLAMSNLLNVGSNKGRALLTFAGTVVALLLSIFGIIDRFQEFLALTALFYSPIAGIIFTDYFLRYKKWEDHGGWNWMATIALAVGITLGYVTTYVSPVGIPAIQCLAVTGAVYFAAMKIKASIKPDEFTPEFFKKAA